MKVKEKLSHPDFFQLVYQLVKTIPPGRVSTYGAIAACISSPSAARMVGWALNKLDISENNTPAHRVVNRNGLLTGKFHFGGEHLMADMLQSEGIKIKNNKILDFDRVFFQPESISVIQSTIREK